MPQLSLSNLFSTGMCSAAIKATYTLKVWSHLPLLCHFRQCDCTLRVAGASPTKKHFKENGSIELTGQRTQSCDSCTRIHTDGT